MEKKINSIDSDHYMSSDEKNNTNQAKAVKLKGLWNNIYKNVFKREKGQDEPETTQKKKLTTFDKLTSLLGPIKRTEGVKKLLKSKILTPQNCRLPEDKNVAMAIKLPPGISHKNTDIVIDLEMIKRDDELPQLPLKDCSTAKLLFTKQLGANSIFEGVIRVPSNVDVSALMNMPLYLFNSNEDLDHSNLIGKPHVIVKPAMNSVVAEVEKGMGVGELFLKINFETDEKSKDLIKKQKKDENYLLCKFIETRKNNMLNAPEDIDETESGELVRNLKTLNNGKPRSTKRSKKKAATTQYETKTHQADLGVNCNIINSYELFLERYYSDDSFSNPQIAGDYATLSRASRENFTDNSQDTFYPRSTSNSNASSISMSSSRDLSRTETSRVTAPANSRKNSQKSVNFSAHSSDSGQKKTSNRPNRNVGISSEGGIRTAPDQTEEVEEEQDPERKIFDKKDITREKLKFEEKETTETLEILENAREKLLTLINVDDLTSKLPKSSTGKVEHEPPDISETIKSDNEEKIKKSVSDLLMKKCMLAVGEQLECSNGTKKNFVNSICGQISNTVDDINFDALDCSKRDVKKETKNEKSDSKTQQGNCVEVEVKNKNDFQTIEPTENSNAANTKTETQLNEQDRANMCNIKDKPNFDTKNENNAELDLCSYVKENKTINIKAKEFKTKVNKIKENQTKENKSKNNKTKDYQFKDAKIKDNQANKTKDFKILSLGLNPTKEENLTDQDFTYKQMEAYEQVLKERYSLETKENMNEKELTYATVESDVKKMLLDLLTESRKMKEDIINSCEISDPGDLEFVENPVNIVENIGDIKSNSEFIQRDIFTILDKILENVYTESKKIGDVIKSKIFDGNKFPKNEYRPKIGDVNSFHSENLVEDNFLNNNQAVYFCKAHTYQNPKILKTSWVFGQNCSEEIKDEDKDIKDENLPVINIKRHLPKSNNLINEDDLITTLQKSGNFISNIYNEICSCDSSSCNECCISEALRIYNEYTLKVQHLPNQNVIPTQTTEDSGNSRIVIPKILNNEKTTPLTKEEEKPFLSGGKQLKHDATNTEELEKVMQTIDISNSGCDFKVPTIPEDRPKRNTLVNDLEEENLSNDLRKIIPFMDLTNKNKEIENNNLERSKSITEKSPVPGCSHLVDQSLNECSSVDLSPNESDYFADKESPDYPMPKIKATFTSNIELASPAEINEIEKNIGLNDQLARMQQIVIPEEISPEKNNSNTKVQEGEARHSRRESKNSMISETTISITSRDSNGSNEEFLDAKNFVEDYKSTVVDKRSECCSVKKRKKSVDNKRISLGRNEEKNENFNENKLNEKNSGTYDEKSDTCEKITETDKEKNEEVADRNGS